MVQIRSYMTKPKYRRPANITRGSRYSFLVTYSTYDI